VRILITIATLLALSGCAAALVGGAAVGGYHLGKDERPPAVVAADSAITTKIKAKLAADSTVSVFAIGVKTRENVVTLTGDVGSYVAREQAERIAKSTGGVTAVNNLVVVEDRSVPK